MIARKELKQELWVAFLIATAASFLLGSYECVRSAGNTLFKAAYGASNLALVGAALPIVLVGCLKLYGVSLSHSGPRVTLRRTYFVSLVLLSMSYLATFLEWQFMFVILYLFRKIYVVILIEQYWSFLNSQLSTETAKRLNGPICGGATVGAIIAGYWVGATAVSVGTPMMLVFSGGLLIPAAFCSDLAYRFGGEPKPEIEELSAERDDLSAALLFGSPLLKGLLFVVVATQVLSAALELNFQTILQNTIPDPDPQTAYSGNFFGTLNLVAFVLQFLITPLLLRKIPLGAIHFALPIIHLVVGVVVLFHPTLSGVGLALLIFKGTDYSLFRAAKEILYIPLSFDARYRAKQIIDSFGYRGGEGFASMCIFVLQRTGMVLHLLYSMVGLIAVVSWGAALWRWVLPSRNVPGSTEVVKAGR